MTESFKGLVWKNPNWVDIKFKELVWSSVNYALQGVKNGPVKLPVFNHSLVQELSGYLAELKDKAEKPYQYWEEVAEREVSNREAYNHRLKEANEINAECRERFKELAARLSGITGTPLEDAFLKMTAPAEVPPVVSQNALLFQEDVLATLTERISWLRIAIEKEQQRYEGEMKLVESLLHELGPPPQGLVPEWESEEKMKLEALLHELGSPPQGIPPEWGNPPEKKPIS